MYETVIMTQVMGSSVNSGYKVSPERVEDCYR